MKHQFKFGNTYLCSMSLHKREIHLLHNAVAARSLQGRNDKA